MCSETSRISSLGVGRNVDVPDLNIDVGGDEGFYKINSVFMKRCDLVS